VYNFAQEVAAMWKNLFGSKSSEAVQPVQIFGFRLRRVLWRAVLPHPLSTSAEEYFKLYDRKHLHWLSMLMNPGDERFTYELRVIGQPCPTRPQEGHVTVALLLALRNATASEAEAAFMDLRRSLEASFPEYEFVPIQKEELQKVLAPFPIETGWSLTRRWGPVRLDTLASADTVESKAMGFLPANEPSSPQHRMQVIHIYPFEPTNQEFDGLFKHLLLLPFRTMIVCRLQPTRLTAVEAEFFEEQIANCERFMRVEASTRGADVSSIYPTLRERAHLHQQHFLRLLYSLQDDAAALTLEVFGEKPLPPFLLETVGHMVSSPARGAVFGSRELSLGGGYNLQPIAELSQAVQSLQEVAMRFTPQDQAFGPGRGRVPFLFPPEEALAAFRLPPCPQEALMGVELRRVRLNPVVPPLPEAGASVGATSQAWHEVPVRIPYRDRLRHVYTVGQTGAGKTTVLLKLIVDDIRAGYGVCLLDPHGDLFQDVLSRIPQERLEDVVIVDPNDTESPVRFNPLEVSFPEEVQVVVSELADGILRMLEDTYGARAGQFAGPMFYRHLTTNAALVARRMDPPGTLFDLHKIFTEQGYWKKFAGYAKGDPYLEDWVKSVLPNVDYLKQGSDAMSLGDWVASKLVEFLGFPSMRAIFDSPRSTVRFDQCMNEGKIVLVNLAKGLLSERLASFFGRLLLAKLQAAAFQRIRMPKERRRPFFVYVDEFQNLAGQHFITLLSEGRKFGVGLVLANQYLTQIQDQRLREGLLSNVGNFLIFRVSPQDAELLGPFVWPSFSKVDLGSLPNWAAVACLQAHGTALLPFVLETRLPQEKPDPAIAQEVYRLSQQKYGLPISSGN